MFSSKVFFIYDLDRLTVSAVQAVPVENVVPMPARKGPQKKDREFDICTGSATVRDFR